MKRLLAFTLAVLVLLSCPALADSITTKKDAFGNLVMIMDSGKNIGVEKLPYSIEYNAKTIPFVSISAYQEKAQHSYTLFVIVTLDVSALSDDEVYWLRKDDLDVSLYATQENNGFDFDSLSKLGLIWWTDIKQIDIVFTSPFTDEYRYPFNDIEVFSSVSLKQEETYQYTSSTTNKTSRLNKSIDANFKHVFSSGEFLKPSDIHPSLVKQINGWLGDRAQFYADLMGTLSK